MCAGRAEQPNPKRTRCPSSLQNTESSAPGNHCQAKNDSLYDDHGINELQKQVFREIAMDFPETLSIIREISAEIRVFCRKGNI